MDRFENFVEIAFPGKPLLVGDDNARCVVTDQGKGSREAERHFGKTRLSDRLHVDDALHGGV